jgi:hypothetical protein
MIKKILKSNLLVKKSLFYYFLVEMCGYLRAFKELWQQRLKLPERLELR